jgi:AraC-like DNA-binding protein
VTTVIRVGDQAPADRLEYWRSVLCDTFLPLEAIPAGDTDRPIEGTLRFGELGVLKVCEVTGNSQVVQRLPAQISRADPEYLKVAVQLGGRGVLTQSGREAVLHPGDFAAYDSSRPFSMAFDDWFQLVVVMCPRTAIRLSPAELDAVYSTRISGQNGVGALVSSFLAGLVGTLDDDQPELAPAVDGSLSDAVLDLLAAGLADAGAGADPASLGRHARQETLLRQIRGYIETNLQRPDLTPDTIAAAHFISTRYLHKLFARQGDTVAGWTRGRRLERCRQDLRNPSLRHHSISAIGARWGLVDASHFSRAFRAAYGVTPSEYRLGSAPAVNQRAV